MKDKITISRVAAVLTPFFAALAGWITTLAGRYLPGAPRLDKTEITALFIIGFAGAAGSGITWLKGLSKHEENQTLLELNAPYQELPEDSGPTADAVYQPPMPPTT